MLTFDLGSHTFKISTTSAKAQQLFDQGLNWCFGFNQEEGVACFNKALEYDPQCAMLHWGIAYAAGPFYNMPWSDFSIHEQTECTAFCRSHLDQAVAKASSAPPMERALVAALSERIQQAQAMSVEAYKHWDDAYANAMRQVNADFPNNQDVMALFIEAMMTRTPWDMWDVHTGLPTQGADTIEAIEVCEHAISLADKQGVEQHPAILHLHIHLLEMSNNPEMAMDSANRLFGLCPDAGHTLHMPGHIYVLCGDYEKAKQVSEQAISVNRKYLAYAGPHNYYTTARCHDLHLMMYTCMFLGQFEPAMAAANEICDNLPPDVIDLKDKPYIAGTMEGYYSMRMHVLVRFGKWQDIVDEPLPEDQTLYCVTTAMHHYAKGIAYAALKQFELADEQKACFYQALKCIPSNRKLFNNPAVRTLGVGEMMLLGELEYHKGHVEQAFSHLRTAVHRCEQLQYSEPWPWMHPPRHALGALLLAQGRYEEAEQVYRADLGMDSSIPRCAQHRKNIWALHGLVECLEYRDEQLEIVELKTQLEEASSKTDISISSSCCCRHT